MKTRALGNQGLKVSEIGLGCMGLSDFYSTSGATEEQAISLIHLALDLGVNFLDTSDAYGPHTNERTVGKALKGRRDGVVLATKFGIVRQPGTQVRGIDGRPEYVRSACDASLARLGVSVIDLYYQHRVDPKVPIEETVGAMKELVEAGKVRYIGLSEVGAETIRRAHQVHPISAVQSEYSLWERGIEESVLPAMRELGIGLVPFSPLGRGYLTGALQSSSTFVEGDFRRGLPRFDDAHMAANRKLVDIVKSVAQRRGATTAQVALAWILIEAPDAVPIPGTKRRTYLDDNLGAANLRLTAEDMAELNGLASMAVGERYPPAMSKIAER